MAIISMSPDGDLDQDIYLNELFRANKPKQQNKTFWFPTPQTPAKIEDHTPIQKRILENYWIYRTKENAIRKTTLNLELKALNLLIGLIYC